jgi:hypothetical protein
MWHIYASRGAFDNTWAFDGAVISYKILSRRSRQLFVKKLVDRSPYLV